MKFDSRVDLLMFDSNPHSQRICLVSFFLHPTTSVVQVSSISILSVVIYCSMSCYHTQLCLSDPSTQSQLSWCPSVGLFCVKKSLYFSTDFCVYPRFVLILSGLTDGIFLDLWVGYSLKLLLGSWIGTQFPAWQGHLLSHHLLFRCFQ